MFHITTIGAFTDHFGRKELNPFSVKFSHSTAQKCATAKGNSENYLCRLRLKAFGLNEQNFMTKSWCWRASFKMLVAMGQGHKEVGLLH